MTRTCKTWTMAVVCLCCWLGSGAAPLSAETFIVPANDATTYFAGDDQKLRYRIRTTSSVTGRVFWSFSVDGRTLSRGEQPLVVAAGEMIEVETPLRTGSLAPGVIIPIQARLEFLPAVQDSPDHVELRRTIWLFPRDALVGKQTWAQQLRVELLDPSGDTEQRLNDIGLPFARLTAVPPTPNPPREGVLLIGEGHSLKASSVQPAQLLAAAAAGRKVLLLGAAEGDLELPGFTTGEEQFTIPGTVTFGREKTITEIDKRLDARHWSGAASGIPSQRLTWLVRHERSTLTVTSAAQGWPWVKIEYPDTGGTFIYCGFKIIENWDHGPTPRVLLISILESLVPNVDSASK